MSNLKRQTLKTGDGQAEKFKSMAQELEADDDEYSFDKALKKLAMPKPPKPRKND